MNDSPLNILLIGFGNMGRALYEGWQKQNHTIIVVDPAAEAGEGKFNTVTDDVKNFNPDIVVFAVKPQILNNVLSDYTHLKNTAAVILSIMGGKSISIFADFFGDVSVVRSMPNTPAMVGQGMTVCVANERASEAQKTMIHSLMSAVGDVAWVDDEELIHGVTGVSGSGPAYIFHLIEAMTMAGIDAGLPEDFAKQLARQTVIGAAALADQSDEAASTLRERVTSPGGTTQAALDILMKDGEGLKELMTQAVSAAAIRSKTLS